jgi:hypothetical protein
VRSVSIWPLPATIAAAALLMLAVMRHYEPPAPAPIDAAPDRFSAERALADLRDLLGDEAPHPVGSTANRALRLRLIARLEAMGLRPEVQSAIGCSAKFAACASVHNVLAEIRGTGRDAIALMAHYDSVASAPGAGDDGAGVAAILEIARIIDAAPEHRNRVLLVFTDAEETGLLGAEAFFAEHPWAVETRVVINLEGSGSDGPVFLLRSGPNSGHLIDTFRRVAPYPMAESMAEEIFRRMPNDTDFSVAMRADKPGIDFAFSGERNHYHSPLDTIARLNPATMQHHGENTLPLVKALLDRDLSKTAPGRVYTSISASWWFHWTPGTGMALALMGLALILVACWRSHASAASISIGALAAAGVVILIVMVEIGLLGIADQLAGVRPNWPANPWPWRLILYGTPIAAIALLGPWLARRLHGDAVLLGAWLVWGTLAAAMAWFLPLAAYMLIVPLLPAAVVCVALVFYSGSADVSTEVRGWLSTAAMLPAAWFLLGLAYAGELTQGLKLAPTVFGPLALLAMAALPTASADRRRIMVSASVLAIALGLALTAVVAPYSADRPQHLNLVYVGDADGHSASVVAISEDAVPASVSASAAFAANAQPFPWGGSTFTAAAMAASPLSPATFTAARPTKGWRRYRLTAPSDGQMVRLWFVGASFAANAEIAGHTVQVPPAANGSDFRSLTFHVPPAAGVEFALQATSEEPVTGYVAVYRLGLPVAAQPMLRARDAVAVPASTGDMTVSYQKVSM